jgi:hypothetical protein
VRATLSQVTKNDRDPQVRAAAAAAAED